MDACGGAARISVAERGTSNPNPNPNPNPDPNLTLTLTLTLTLNLTPNPNQARGGAPHARLGAPSERQLEGALLALLCSLAEAEAEAG